MDSSNCSTTSIGFPSTGAVSSGSLKTKISLKEGYSRPLLVCSFYLMKPELPREAFTGILSLIVPHSYFCLEIRYERFYADKVYIATL